MGLETTTSSWTETDEQFFAIAAHLFSTEFAYGASVLLASYDREDEAETTRTVVPAIRCDTTVDAQVPVA